MLRNIIKAQNSASQLLFSYISMYYSRIVLEVRNLMREFPGMAWNFMSDFLLVSRLSWMRFSFC